MVRCQKVVDRTLWNPCFGVNLVGQEIVYIALNYTAKLKVRKPTCQRRNLPLVCVNFLTACGIGLKTFEIEILTLCGCLGTEFCV